MQFGVLDKGGKNANKKYLQDHLVAPCVKIIYMKKFAERLKELREEKEMSARQLAKSIGVSNRAVQRWEKVERIPSAEAVVLLAKFFGVTTDYLLGLEN